MAQPLFGRLITAMITPFDDEGGINLERTEEFADRLVKGGTDSIVVCGTTGESPTVSHSQKIDVIKAVVNAVDDRIPVVANVGNNCTADTIDFPAIQFFFLVFPGNGTHHRRNSQAGRNLTRQVNVKTD